MAEENLRTKTRRGSLWSISGTIGSQAISFGIGVALARILAPADFGVVAACLIFIEVSSTLVASSFTSALVRKPEVTATDLSTAFVLQLTTAGLAIIVIAILSPVVSALMSDPTVGKVLVSLSMGLLVVAFRGPPTVLARRAMDFKPLALSNWLEMISFGVIALSMAVSGAGVWSLVVSRVAASAIAVAQLAVTMRWKPSFAFSMPVCRSIMGVAIQFAGKEVLEDISRNISYTFAGVKLGMESLGFYARAHNLMMLPVTRLSMSVSSVLFPAFAKIQDDESALHWSLQRAICVVSIVIFPLLAGLLVVAPSLVPLLYGERWSPSIVPLQILCVAGILYSVEPVAVSLINAKNLLMDDIKRQSAHVVILIIAILLLGKWDTFGIALAVVFAAICNWLMLMYLLSRRIGFSASQYVASVFPAMIACIVMATLVTILQRILLEYQEINDGWLLLVSIVCGAAFYWLVLWWLERLLDWGLFTDAFSEVKDVITTASRPVTAAIGRLI